ncbi:hypothetical protein [Actinomadura sp. NEAU-AAG7]|uniref:hypothetical protein n=1 Tax=Actinomadura sp. NEAU-AAG7 TaxID=2839640 RepID=UPI001BE3D562|nr:hypothetical protein [Actinomadura sp. NEAU-AAG7]MBT2212357.1 hypothetical protein [Actinomadura sp. NEAU-AAG7]
MSQPWTTISDGGPARPVVLAVDYDATGRRDATFRDLVELLPSPLTVRLSGQPPRGERTDAQLLDRWAGDLPATVGAILGYCAGSIFACALADRIERERGTRPATVLFNPGRPDASTLRRDFDGVVGSMSLLDPRERADFLEKAAKQVAATPDDFDEVAGALYELYGQASRITFERADIDADVGEELVAVFGSYISYLRAARRVEPGPGWARGAAVVSRDHVQPAAFTPNPVRTGLERERLLGDPAVAQAVVRLIGAEE